MGGRERVKRRQMKALNVNGEALNDDVKALEGDVHALIGGERR